MLKPDNRVGEAALTQAERARIITPDHRWLDDPPDAADSTLHERAAVPDQPRGNVVVGWEGLIVTVLHAPCNQLQERAC